MFNWVPNMPLKMSQLMRVDFKAINTIPKQSPSIRNKGLSLPFSITPFSMYCQQLSLLRLIKASAVEQECKSLVPINEIKCFIYSHSGGVLRLLSNMYDGAFLKTQLTVKAINHFRKMLHLSCLIRFQIHLCIQLCLFT